MALWVFGYGSLLWNPGFTPATQIKARLDGYARSFCMLSIHHRGTENDPGLVLALDEQDGAQCTGMAFQVAATDEEHVLAGLRERELISSAYYEAQVPLICDNGQTITALAYIIDPDHRQYCRYDLERQAQIIARAHGGRGANADYLFKTADKLRILDIPDADLDWLVIRVQTLLNG